MPEYMYARVLSGVENCALCRVASTQLYHSGDLMPIHPGCDCGVELVPESDRARWKAEKRAELEDLQDQMDEAGLNSSSDQKDLSQLIVTEQHGEYGPTLAWRQHEFTGAKGVRGGGRTPIQTTVVRAPETATPAPATKPVGDPKWMKKTTPKYAQDSLRRQVADLSDDQTNTVSEYVQSGLFDPINRHARGLEASKMDEFFQGSPEEFVPWARQTMDDLDEVLDKTRTEFDLILYRGMDHGAAGGLIKRGQIIQDPGYVSTSLDPKIAAGFGKDVWRIELPAGSRALYVDALGDDVSLGQKEVLLPRDQKFQVVSVVDGGDGVRVINVRLVG